MRHRLALLALALGLAPAAHGHVANHASVHDAMAAIIERIRASVPVDSLAGLDEQRLTSFITDEERHVLATEYWTFRVDVPVTVSVMRAELQGEMPFWLLDRGFVKTDMRAIVNREPVEVWQRDFEAGPIGLGINGLRDSRHYFAVLTPREPGESITVSQMYPGQQAVSVLRVGGPVYADELGYRLEEAPAELNGQLLLCPVETRSADTQLVRLFRTTDHPATETPDQVVLTWSDDPRTTQAIQWRTSTAVMDGMIRHRRMDMGEDHPYEQTVAAVTRLRDPYLVNDPVVHRLAAVLRELEPGTAYTYTVGSATADRWSEPRAFTTAPAEEVAFSFIYMGDVQAGMDSWGTLVHAAFARHPHAAFHLIAGDLVNRGNQRDDWDDFFYNSRDIYDRRQLVPALGNHEYQGPFGPWMYHRIFTLPENGPMRVPGERSYSFRYSNALFVVLDSNQPVDIQTEWLEEQLAGSDAVWKFVCHHHPSYSSKGERDNREVRKGFGGLYDKYHVDLVMQGHDHAYLRTHPMRGEERASSTAEGTVYILSNAGGKMYQQDLRDYTDVGYTNLSMYQVLDIAIEGHQLTYRAYEGDGRLRDEFVIQK